ncbi:kyphoscoliosis peptidase-like [Rhinophrynus dorsalis]
MALHHRLSLWQKILLGIFCFPLLPFYLCVYCLSIAIATATTSISTAVEPQLVPPAPAMMTMELQREKKEWGSEDSNLEENWRGVIGDRDPVVSGQQENNLADPVTGQEEEVQVPVRITGSWARRRAGSCLKNDEEEKGTGANHQDNGHVGNTKIAPTNKRPHLDYRNTGYKEEDETISPTTKKQEDNPTPSLDYTIENSIAFPKREKQGHKPAPSISHVKDAQVAPTHKNIQLEYINTGYIEVEDDIVSPKRKKTKAQQTLTYRYPWDRSNLKSLQIDLKALKELDAYASKINTNKTIDHLVKDLLRNAHTDLEKTRAVWMWICHHIEYDTEGLKNLSKVSTDPNDVLRTRKGVCAGYSSLFERMCSIAGVKCKTVSGHAKGAGYKVGQEFTGDSNHAWNMVYLEEGWHLLDSTWGAGHVNDNFTFAYDEFYFLTHPALFIENHFPIQKEDQLLETHISLKQFEQMAHHKSHFYSLGLLSSQPNKAIVQTVKGKASFTIESRHHMLFMFDLNKTETPGLIRLMDHGMNLDVYPQKTGQQVLQIYAKAEDAEGSYNWVLGQIIDCKAVDTSMKIPKCLHNPVGPSWLSEKAGLLHPSHPDPVIHTEDGCCAISFTLEKDLSLFSTLDSDEIKMTSDMRHRHILQRQTKNKVEFKVRVPQSGTYVLHVNLKVENRDEYTSQCNYLISGTNSTMKWPIFPLQYTTWAKHYELVEPLDGILPENCTVFFKLQIPGVTGVSVRGKTIFSLTLSDQGYWEGNCSTTGSKEMNVSVSYKKQPNTWMPVLQYQVGNRKQ